MPRPASAAFLAWCAAAHALHPIHDAAVDFFPSFQEYPGEASFKLGQYYTHDADARIRVQAGYLHPLGQYFQVGAGVATRWLDEANNVRHLALGSVFSPTHALSFHADFLWGLADAAGDALVFGGSYLSEPLDFLHLEALGRVGFLDALVWDPGYTVFAAGITPKLLVHRNARLELEAFFTWQMPGIEDRFTLDLAPSLAFLATSTLSLRAGADFGLLGPGKSAPRFHLTQQFRL